VTRVAGRANLLALALALAVAVGAVVLAVDPAPAATGGFRHVGPPVFLDRLVTVPSTTARAGPTTLLAGGSGLYAVTVTARAGAQPDVEVAAVPAVPGSALVLGLDVAPASAGPATAAAPDRVFVGTVDGLLAASRPAGPYRRLPLHGGGVHGIAVDPHDPSVIWATSYAGPQRSTDGGRTWTVECRGMRAPTTSWAITYVPPPSAGGKGALVASDQDAVYLWTGSSWAVSTPQLAVVSLDATAPGVVFASSMGAGIREGRLGTAGDMTWDVTDRGIPRSGGDPPGVHVVSVTAGTAPTATIYAGTMVAGLATSADGGASWTVTWPSLAASGDVWRVLPVGDVLVAATDNGVLASVQGGPGGGSSRWLLAAAGGAGAVLAAAAGGLAGLRRRRLAHRAGP
jgi:hypothetical protein